MDRGLGDGAGHAIVRCFLPTALCARQTGWARRGYFTLAVNSAQASGLKESVVRSGAPAWVVSRTMTVSTVATSTQLPPVASEYVDFRQGDPTFPPSC